MNIKVLLKDPFIHFLALGTVIFLFSALWGSRNELMDREVFVSVGDVARLEAMWEGQYSRPPTPDERASIIDAHIREEILFREAQALDLGSDDVIVRRRLVQKFLFLSDDLIQVATPPDADLQAWFEERSNTYLIAPQVSFRHVYLSADKRGEAARGDAAIMIAQLNREDSSWRSKGDPFMLQREYAARKGTQISDLFGVGFSRDLAILKAGVWSGPVRSAYGWHAVKILQRAPQSLPSLAEVREDVLADYKAEQRDGANKALYQAILARYSVTIEPAAPKGEGAQ